MEKQNLNYECFYDQGAKETEEKDTEDETVGAHVPERKRNGTKNHRGGSDGKAKDADEGLEAEDRDIASVDPALNEQEVWLDFETWKEMMENTPTGENYNQNSLYWFPSQEEDPLQPGDSSTSQVCFHNQGAKETEEKDAEDETVGVNYPEGKGNKTKNYEGEPYGDQDAEEYWEAEDRGILSVDPALNEQEKWLDFETWKEMMENIPTGESYNQDSLYSFPSPDEDTFQPADGSTSEATEEEPASLEEDLLCTVDEVTSEPDEVASGKPLPSSCSDTALSRGRGLRSQPSRLFPPNYFPVPIFQQIPPYFSVPRWGPSSWGPNPRRGWTMMQGRGAPFRPPFWPNQGQGRAFPNIQTPQHTVNSWRLPMIATLKARGACASVQGMGCIKQQNPQLSGSKISSQSGGGRTQSPQLWGAHILGLGGPGHSRGSAHPPGRGGAGQGRGSIHPAGRGGPGQGRGSAHPPGRGSPRQGRGSAHPPGQGGPGQGRGSAHPPGRGSAGQGRQTYHSGGPASSSKGASNRQTSHHGGFGSGSAKGSQRK